MSGLCRLIYPQWQGAHFPANSFYKDQFFPELSEQELATGYALGARLSAFLAPAAGAEVKTITVPVSMDCKREVQDNIIDRDVIAAQSAKALALLQEADPDKIVTFGGECSVSVVPFTYLNHKYNLDDAHPDITLPGDAYDGYNAMACAACLGLGDRKIVGQMPSAFSAAHTLLVGVRDWECDEIKERQQQLGIANRTTEQLREQPELLGRKLQEMGCSHAVVHFDLDVLDPAEVLLAVGRPENGLRSSEVVNIINTVSQHTDLVGLTVAEHLPQVEIILQRILSRLPLLQ